MLLLQGNNNAKQAYLWLKINLNLSDLFILLGHCLGKLGWMATYEWMGGSTLCKLYEYLSMAAIYTSSNMIVVVAIDRLTNVLHASSVRANVVSCSDFLCFKHSPTCAAQSSTPVDNGRLGSGAYLCYSTADNFRRRQRVPQLAGRMAAVLRQRK